MKIAEVCYVVLGGLPRASLPPGTYSQLQRCAQTDISSVSEGFHWYMLEEEQPPSFPQMRNWGQWDRGLLQSSQVSKAGMWSCKLPSIPFPRDHSIHTLNVFHLSAISSEKQKTELLNKKNGNKDDQWYTTKGSEEYSVPKTHHEVNAIWTGAWIDFRNSEGREDGIYTGGYSVQK